MEYLNLFKILHERGLRYLVCGGLAVNIYGIPRMTADVDLLLDFESDNLRRFEKALTDIGYAARVPISIASLEDEAKRQQLIREKNLIAFSYYSTRSNFMSVDVLMQVPLSFDEMWQQRETRRVFQTDVQIVSLDHLIALKKHANRIQDNQDVLLLSKLREAQSDN